MDFVNNYRFFSEYVMQHTLEIPFLRKLVRFANLHFSPKEDMLIKVHNHKMYANTFDRILVSYLWKFSILESFETKLMEKIIKRDMVVFDIGANLGYYTLIFAGLTGEGGKVYSFEPEPENYKLLLKNIMANRYNNVIPIQKAVSDKEGKIKFFISEEDKGNHSIYNFGNGGKATKVETTTLDKFTRGKIKPNVIKLDVEGAEFLAVQGMDNLIRNNKDITMICEFWPYALRKCDTSPKEFIKKLENYGFEIKFINEIKRRIEPVNRNSLLGICSGKKYVNLFLEK